MQEFEERTLNSVKHIFEKYVGELSNIGLALDIRLAWCNRGSEEWSYSRIQYSYTYMCYLEIIVRKKEDPQFDIDLQCICHIHPISQCSMYFWRPGTKFSKVPEKYFTDFIEQAETTIQQVLNEGYESVLQEIIDERNHKK